MKFCYRVWVGLHIQSLCSWYVASILFHKVNYEIFLIPQHSCLGPLNFDRRQYKIKRCSYKVILCYWVWAELHIQSLCLWYVDIILLKKIRNIYSNTDDWTIYWVASCAQFLMGVIVNALSNVHTFVLCFVLLWSYWLFVHRGNGTIDSGRCLINPLNAKFFRGNIGM